MSQISPVMILHTRSSQSVQITTNTKCRFLLYSMRNLPSFLHENPSSKQKHAAIVGPNPPIVSNISGMASDDLNDVVFTSKAIPHQQTQLIKKVMTKYLQSLFFTIPPRTGSGVCPNILFLHSIPLHLFQIFLILPVNILLLLMCNLCAH